MADLAELNIQEKTIGDNRYYVRPFPALMALELLGDLQAVLTGAVGRSISDDVEVGSFLDKKINMGAAIAAIGQQLKGPVLVSFAQRLILEDYISVKRLGKEEPERLSKLLFNNIFQRNLKELFELVFFILEVNYSDFFDGLPDLSGVLTGLVHQRK